MKDLIKIALISCLMFFMGYLLIAFKTEFTPGCPFDAGGNNAKFIGYVQLYSRTTTQLNAITPTAVGQVYWNSTTSEFYISTGTAVNQFVHK